MDSMWTHSSNYLIYMMKHIPCGIHVESMEYTHSIWNPYGMWGDGKVNVRTQKRSTTRRFISTEHKVLTTTDDLTESLIGCNINKVCVG